MKPTKFRKKPVTIEAVQWDGTAEGASPIIQWVLDSGGNATYQCLDIERCTCNDGDSPHEISIRTLEGSMSARIGWWVIRGVQGEFYPCRGDIFEATYERAGAGA